MPEDNEEALRWYLLAAEQGYADAQNNIAGIYANADGVPRNVREAARLGQRVVLLSSRPGKVAGEWRISQTVGRRIESPEVAALSVEITEQLRKEIRRNAA